MDKVLAGETPLRDFYDWFVTATLNVNRFGNDDATRLTNVIEHVVFDLKAGALTSREAKQELVDAMSIYVVTATPWNRAAGPPMATRCASDTIEDHPAAFLLEPRRAAAIAS